MISYPILPLRSVHPHNPRHEWLEKDYPGFLHTLFMQGHHAGIFLLNRLYPFGFRSGYSFNATVHGEPRLDWFWDARELKRVREVLINKSKKNLNFFMRMYRAWKRDHAISIREYNRAEKVDFHSLSDHELYNIYHRLYWANIRQGAHAYLADSFLTAGTDDWLTEFIQDRIPSLSNLNEAVEALTAATIPTYASEADRSLARLVPLVKNYRGAKARFIWYLRKKPNVWQRLAQHANKWYWVENNYFAKVLSAEYFGRKLYDLHHESETPKLSTVFEKNATRKKALLRRYRDRWLINVMHMSELMTHMQDYRKMSLVRFNHFLHIIFREMSRRRNMVVEDFYNIVEPEMEDVFLRGRVDMKRIRERRKKNFAYSTPRGYRIFEGSSLRRYVRETDFIPRVSGVQEIFGTPASPGRAVGRVRLVMNAHKPGIFSVGDILVTNNTTPEFAPLMKKAGAIITDQGGITTHAAIVSRELGIPCIIGTKIGSKVLKTGDRVEVDATKGVVRKL